MYRFLMFLFLLFQGDDTKLGEHCYVCRPDPCTRWPEVVTYRQVGRCALNDKIINESCDSYKRYMAEGHRSYHHQFGYIKYNTRTLHRHTKPTGDTSPYECEVEVREILRKREL
jgi:hypothetical protein